MIDIQVKSREPIVMNKELEFILSNMPTRMSMKMNRTGSVAYKGYRKDSGGLLITKEERDSFGNITSLRFAKVPSGADCRWEDRESYPYPSNDQT